MSASQRIGPLARVLTMQGMASATSINIQDGQIRDLIRDETGAPAGGAAIAALVNAQDALLTDADLAGRRPALHGTCVAALERLALNGFGATVHIHPVDVPEDLPGTVAALAAAQADVGIRVTAFFRADTVTAARRIAEAAAKHSGDGCRIGMTIGDAAPGCDAIPSIMGEAARSTLPIRIDAPLPRETWCALHRNGLLGEHVTLGAVACDGAFDLAAVASTGMEVVATPVADLMYRRASPVSLSALSAAGIRVALGVDGLARRADFDALAQLRLAWLLDSRSGTAPIAAEEMLSAAAAGNRIAQGAAADILTLDLDAPGAADPDAVLENAAARHVASLHVGGRTIMENGQLVSRTGTPRARAADDDLRERRSKHADRRLVTIMFCDMVGSTRLSTMIDPEDLIEIIHRYRALCKDAIEQHGGFVAHYIGDGIVAYFGYPEAGEDDAGRAAKAAMTALRQVPALNASISLPGDELKIRIGIATGEVVVGFAWGESYTQEASVLGETPNVAARLESIASPNSVVICDTTRRLAGGGLDIEDLGMHDLKGIPQPRRLWQVNGERTDGNAPVAARDAMPAFGRESELSMLRACLSASRSGSGRAVALSGEAGVGKTHLLETWLDEIDSDGCAVLRFQCSRYHTNSALHPVVERIGWICGFQDTDDDARRRTRLADWLGQVIEAPDPDLVRDLERVLGITEQTASSDRRDLSSSTPLVQSLAALIQRMSRQRPMVIVFEDTHFIDPSSRTLLSMLIDQAKSGATMVVHTQRTGAEAQAARATHVHHVALQPLNRADSRRLLDAAARGRSFPAGVSNLVLDRTGGVPLFIVELAAALLEAGAAGESGSNVTVPETLQSTLMARLDKLGPARDAAVAAAVLGGAFTRDMLACMVSLDDGDVEAVIEQLSAAGILAAEGPATKRRYRFRTGLMRDVAYGSLLRDRRRALHALAAESLEERFPRLVEDEPELLAHHYTEAGQPEKADTYWEIAGRRAMDRFAEAEAIANLAKTVDTFVARDDDYQSMLLQADLGAEEMQARGFGYGAAAEAFLRAVQRKAIEADPLTLGRSLKAMVWFQCRRMRLDRAADLVRALLSEARLHGDDGLASAAHNTAGAVAFFTGRLPEAIHHLETGFARYRRADHARLVDDFGIDPGVNSLSLLALSLALAGRPDSARARLAQSLQICEGLSHPITVSVSLSWGARIHAALRDEDGTRDLALQTREHAERTGNDLTGAEADMMLSWINRRQNADNAAATLSAALERKVGTGTGLLTPFYLGYLAETQAEAGELPAAAATLDRAIASAEKDGERFWLPELWRQRGLLLLDLTGNAEQATDCMRTSIDLAFESGAYGLMLRAATNLCSTARGSTAKADAVETLRQVMDRLTEGRGGHDWRMAEQSLAVEHAV